MIYYYCPVCGEEIYWDEDKKGFYCKKCNKYIEEDKVEMIDDDLEGHF